MGFLKGKSKKMFKKKSKDKKQDSRIKSLEKFVYKTIENKQINYTQDLSVTSAGTATYPFLSLRQGVEDGSAYPSNARIGNSITLMSQRLDMNIIGEVNTWNQVRVILAESVDGNTTLALSDILEYADWPTYNDLVFVSPYTTKTSTNKRYKIHMDRLVEVHGTGEAGNSTAQIHKVIKYGKNGKVVKFDDNATEATNHKLHLFMISDSAAAGHPSAAYSMRSIYKDA